MAGNAWAMDQKRRLSMRDQSNQIVDSWKELFNNFLIISCIAITVFLLFTGLQWAVVSTFHYIVSFFPGGVNAEKLNGALLSAPIILFLFFMVGALIRTWLIKKPSWQDAKGDGPTEALMYFYDTYKTQKKADDIVITRYQKPTFLAAIRRSIVTFLTLGVGGSGGLEGPAIPIGEAMGAGWSKVFKCKLAPDLRLFQMAGISAAMCSLLDLPFMAALFAVEVVYSDKLIYRSLLFSLFASILVYILNTHLIHITPLFANVAHTFRYKPLEYGEIALFAILICAPCGLLVKWLVHRMRVYIQQIPLSYRGCVGAFLAFAAAMLAWGVFGISPEHVLGMGETTLVDLFNASAAPELSIWWVLLIILITKLFTTAFTISSGGSAGLFIPAMFMGGMSAACIYFLLTSLGIPVIGDGPALFMVAGICSALVAVLGVPLAAIAFAFEGFGADFGPSAIIAVMSCYFVLERLGKL